MAAPQDLFGLSLSEAELTLVIEVAKAVLLTLGAAISVLIFNTLAKRREQDTALFNEIVKARIIELHALNSKVVFSLATYLQCLEEMSTYANAPVNWGDEKRFKRDEVAIAKIKEYHRTLRAEEDDLKSELSKYRYDIGELGYLALTSRMRYFSGRVRHLWQFYEECLQKWRADLQKTAPLDTSSIQRKVELLIAENVAIEGRRDLVGLVDRIHDDFEKVIRRKGRTTRFAVPIDVDTSTGFYRINLFHDSVRIRLARLLMRPPSGPGGGEDRQPETEQLLPQLEIE